MKKLTTIAAGAFALATLVAANDSGLSVYNNKFAGETVGSSTFLNDPRVIKAVDAAVKDQTLRETLLNASGVTSAPLYIEGPNLFYLACQQNACGNRNWTISLSLKTGAARVCYFDTSISPTTAKIFFTGGKKTTINSDCHRARVDWTR